MSVLISFLITVIFASFLEYWLHRLMHLSPKFGRDLISHYDHHRLNEAQGVLGEFKDYCKAVLPMSLLLLVSVPIGVGALLGASSYAIFSAYAHQLQHENPSKCFWMEMPVHFVHHEHNQWHHNFGLGVDWWDKVFGTYKLIEWQDSRKNERASKGYLQVKWW